ncbi:hypothetical protein AB1Y20_017606 [Prymnesium parvum]|uniref:Uncharacterized protein n=1 Tax=Prymnesium parvum TaxID=97485 RepID=A0AB34JPT5_PRYPA
MEAQLFRPACPMCDFLSLRYRLVLTSARSPQPLGVQLSRVVLYDREHQPIPVLKVITSGSLVARKAQDFTSFGFERAPAAARWRSSALPASIDLWLEMPTQVMAYELYSAFDSPESDPISWSFGALRHDGVFVVLRSVASAVAPWDRGASYGYEHLGAFTRQAAVQPGVMPPDASVGPAGNCSELLLVLLRGDAFRLGESGEHGESGAAPQLEVLQSIASHVLEPAVRMGWWVFPLADVTVPARHIALFRNMTRRTLLLDERAVRLRPRNATQALTLLDALHWSVAAAKSLLRRHAWRALLVLRADLALKQQLQLPEPTFPTQSILVPFQVSDIPFTKLNHIPRVADNMLLVPHCRIGELVRALAAHAARQNLHDLCDWVRCPVSYWLASRHDANSALEQNPLFRMVGRSEALPGCRHRPCGAARPRGMACRWPPETKAHPPESCAAMRCPRWTWKRVETISPKFVTTSSFAQQLAKLKAIVALSRAQSDKRG